ncbi:MAG: hypothetical protein AAF402_07125 [Pseudomonadota bacterium]
MATAICLRWTAVASRLFKNVIEAGYARQKLAKKHAVSEHFEPIFNSLLM